ncbi:MAG: type III-A CRISPR-associated RAMP protein Csm3, partial [Anaerolineaceae bacterium]
EKYTGAPQNQPVGKGVRMHVAKSMEDYKNYWVNPIFGITGDALPDLDTPNRLIVRDVPLSIDSESKLRGARTDMPYTEVKWEAVIDRVTSAASPRQTERVPAGAVFGPMELVFNAFSKEDANLFGHVLTAMQLLEGDYLGGQGSRGSGQISFITLQVCVYSGENYVKHEDARFSELNLAELIEKKADLIEWVSASLAD